MHLLADVLLELVEHALRGGIGESVLAQLPELTGRVGWQGVEEALPHAGIVVIAEAQLGAFPLEDLLEPFR